MSILTEKEDRRKQLESGLAQYPTIPPRMHQAITAYVVNRQPTGDFLTALLHNDLVAAFGRADERNTAALSEWTKLIYNDVPSGCWGSPEVVRAWINGADNDMAATSPHRLVGGC